MSASCVPRGAALTSRIHAGILSMRLTGRVDNGSEYTPPAITAQVRAVGAPRILSGAERQQSGVGFGYRRVH